MASPTTAPATQKTNRRNKERRAIPQITLRRLKISRNFRNFLWKNQKDVLGISMVRLDLFLFFCCFYGGSVFAADKGTANFYQSAPQEYLGKEIRLRVAAVTPVPDLTAADPGFVWMEAVTGRPAKEEGRILIRVPGVDSAKLAKSMNLPSSSGRWLEGTFSGHDSGAVLPGKIKERAPYYIQVSSSAAQKDAPEDMETASGSFVLTPKPKEATPSAVPAAAMPASAPKPSLSAPRESTGPQAVLLRRKAGEPLQLRTAQSVKMEADFCEIIDAEGKLSLVGKPLVAAILPLPKDGSIPTPEETQAALRLYAEKARNLPEAAPLLAEAAASWEKFAGAPAATTASVALPELEDVDTAAGVEEPEAVAGYPAWFGWSTLALSLVLVFLVWILSRPRSYLS